MVKRVGRKAEIYSKIGAVVSSNIGADIVAFSTDARISHKNITLLRTY